MPENEKRDPTKKNDDDQQVPERLPAGGSAAMERLREAEHEEGHAPAREGAEKERE
jgi:hypothetical protein